MDAVTLFSGGDLAGIGIEQAGHRVVGCVEYSEPIAEVCKLNRPDAEVICAKVQDVDPRRFSGVGLLWASPVCKNFSVAKAGGEATDEDWSAAAAVSAWVRALMPRVVIIENVPKYAKWGGFHGICAAMTQMKYQMAVDIIDFASFGVPQNRKRMIARFVMDDSVPPLPERTPWLGWYQAVEDLIDTFPASQFAPWQLKRLPDLMGTTLVEGAASGERPPIMRGVDAPSFTLTCPGGGREHRAFLASANVNGFGFREAEAPAETVKATNTPLLKALLVGTNASESGRLCTREGDEPAFSQTAQTVCRGRAVLVSGQSIEGGRPSTRDGAEPSQSVLTNSLSRNRALLVAGGSASGGNVPTAHEDEPSFTLKANAATREPCPAWLSEGRVVALTPRAIARLQTLPDDYQLPATKTLAGTVLGNGVPVEGARRLVEATCR